jgi:hypothetical protein
MTKQDAIQFGKSSAFEAFDQAGSYGSVQNAVDCYRDNVRDTLNEQGASEWEPEAFAAFDAEVTRLIARAL